MYAAAAASLHIALLQVPCPLYAFGYSFCDGMYVLKAFGPKPAFREENLSNLYII